MITRVFLIRHGATQLSTEDRFAGSTDVPLSADGRAQAERLARRLADDALTAVYASPLERTLDTARIVAAPHGLTPVPWDGLREIHHGHWEGLTRAEVESRYSSEYSRWEEDPYTFAPEGGECGLDVMARALPVVRQIVEAHPGENVGVVSHKATIRLVLSSLLGFDARGYRDRLDQAPGLAEHPGLPRSRSRAPDAVQRHYALCRPPRPAHVTPVALVGRPTAVIESRHSEASARVRYSPITSRQMRYPFRFMCSWSSTKIPGLMAPPGPSMRLFTST
jgi:broad specificity phosphatase PhoE